jgi:hypothetical protein
MPVQRLNVTILPLDLPCSGPVTHSEEILTTGKSHRNKPDWQTFEVASGQVRPERVNKWPNCMTCDDDDDGDNFTFFFVKVDVTNITIIIFVTLTPC